MVGQDPARFRRSTTATRFPCEASDQAKDLALPLPSTTTSYSSGCDTFFPFELIPRVNFMPWRRRFRLRPETRAARAGKRHGAEKRAARRRASASARTPFLAFKLGFRAR